MTQKNASSAKTLQPPMGGLEIIGVVCETVVGRKKVWQRRAARQLYTNKKIHSTK